MKSLYWAQKGLLSKETVVLCRWGIEIQEWRNLERPWKVYSKADIWAFQLLSAMNDTTPTITYFQEMS